MDISNAILAKSDQLNATDLSAGPLTLTITKVVEGNSEQPVNVHFAEFPRPWRPSKSMLRVLGELWGKDTDNWLNHRVTLYREATVKWAGQEVGGIRLSHASGMKGPLKTALTINSKQREVFTVHPLRETTPKPAPTAPAPAPVDAETAARVAALRAEWQQASPDRQVEIRAEVDKLQAGAA